MRRRSLLGAALGAAGAVALLRRRTAERREHVDLYYDDGSMLSLERGAPDAAPLLQLARDALRAAGGSP
jgi:hypothetical protein